MISFNAGQGRRGKYDRPYAGGVTEFASVGGVDPRAPRTQGEDARPAVQGAWVRQLDPATGYQFTVRAVDGAGNQSGSSNTVGAATAPSADVTPPTTPTLLRASDGSNGVCPEELWIRWTGARDDLDAPSAIDYEVRVNGTITEVVPGGTETITYTEVLGANQVTVIAVDRAGNASSPSNAITASTNWDSGC